MGLEAYGGDLNPVAVLVSKGLVEIPPRFVGLPPVNPDARAGTGSGWAVWERALGLAEDIGFYGRWVRERAFERLGHLYPKVRLPAYEGGGEANVIAWLWARTVQSPDPSWDGHVPLVRSWIVRKAKKNKPAVWVEPVVDRVTRTVSCWIQEGGDPLTRGTVNRGVGTCIGTGTTIPNGYLKKQSRAGLMGEQLIAVVAEGRKGRTYLPSESSSLPDHLVPPVGVLDIPMSNSPDLVSGRGYGFRMWADLFTDRQLLALSTFSELLGEVRPVVECDARAAGLVDDGVRLRDGGSGVTAYADAVVTYLAFVVDRLADRNSSFCSWDIGKEHSRNVFGRQAIPMVWDYAENNPFSNSSGNWLGQVRWLQKAVAAAPRGGWGEVVQRDASARIEEVPSPVVSTDPPYYDNISYADLSDFMVTKVPRRVP